MASFLVIALIVLITALAVLVVFVYTHGEMPTVPPLFVFSRDACLTPSALDTPDPDINQVTPSLFISGIQGSQNFKQLRALGITHVVKVFADDGTASIPYTKDPNLRYLVIPSLDTPSDAVLPARAHEAVQFINEAIASGGKVLVHCYAGVSRSATVVLLWMMLTPTNTRMWEPTGTSGGSTTRGMTLDYAYKVLQRTRPIIRPNAGFMEFLRKIDAEV
jgi:hypothetical protein